jgi:hypothetical protein
MSNIIQLAEIQNRYIPGKFTTLSGLNFEDLNNFDIIKTIRELHEKNSIELYDRSKRAYEELIKIDLKLLNNDRIKFLNIVRHSFEEFLSIENLEYQKEKFAPYYMLLYFLEQKLDMECYINNENVIKIEHSEDKNLMNIVFYLLDLFKMNLEVFGNKKELLSISKILNMSLM